MKKSSQIAALLALGFVHQASAAAVAPALKINGYTSMGVVTGKQSNTQNNKGGSPAHVTMNASDLGFTVTGVSASGFEYMYRVNIEAVPGSSMYVNKNYIQFGGDFGTVQLGALKGPEDTMNLSALSIAGPIGAIDGTFDQYYNMSAGVISGVYPGGYTNKANKVTFYSPIVNGFQLGVAFTPDTTVIGRTAKGNSNYLGKSNHDAIYPVNSSKDGPKGRNNWSMGVKYAGDKGAWNYGAAVVMLIQKNYMNKSSSLERQSIRNTKAYGVSGYLGYENAKVAAGWIDNGKSALPRNADMSYGGANNNQVNLGNTHQGDAGRAWNIGGQYTTGPYALALTYYNTSRKTDAKQKAKSDVITASIDYTALQGLQFFGELDVITSKTNADSVRIAQSAMSGTDKAIGNNSGQIVVVGTKISF